MYGNLSQIWMFIYLEIRLVFVFHLIYIPPEIILLIWKRHHSRWRATKLGLKLKKELLHLLLHGTSVFATSSKGPSYWVSFTQSNAYWRHVLTRIPTVFIEKHREINLKMIWTLIVFSFKNAATNVYTIR